MHTTFTWTTRKLLLIILFIYRLIVHKNQLESLIQNIIFDHRLLVIPIILLPLDVAQITDQIKSHQQDWRFCIPISVTYLILHMNNNFQTGMKLNVLYKLSKGICTIIKVMGNSDSQMLNCQIFLVGNTILTPKGSFSPLKWIN